MVSSGFSCRARSGRATALAFAALLISLSACQDVSSVVPCTHAGTCLRLLVSVETWATTGVPDDYVARVWYCPGMCSGPGDAEQGYAHSASHESPHQRFEVRSNGVTGLQWRGQQYRQPVSVTLHNLPPGCESRPHSWGAVAERVEPPHTVEFTVVCGGGSPGDGGGGGGGGPDEPRPN
jgi:hypothetical protein